MAGLGREENAVALRPINGVDNQEELEEEATHHTRECYYGSFFRSITLPFPVKEKEISATLDNGVLELTLPRAEEVKAKKIEIKAQIPQIKAKKKQRKPKQHKR